MAADIIFRNRLVWSTSSGLLDVLRDWLMRELGDDSRAAGWLADRHALPMIPLDTVAEDVGHDEAERIARHLAKIQDRDIAPRLTVTPPAGGRRDLWELRLLATAELADTYGTLIAPHNHADNPDHEPARPSPDLTGVYFATRYYWRANRARTAALVDRLVDVDQLSGLDALLDANGQQLIDMATIEQDLGMDVAAAVCAFMASDALLPTFATSTSPDARSDAHAEVLRLMATDQLAIRYTST